jgi:hypothetical protein
VRERLQKMFAALGKAFDERIEGINLDETSSGFGPTANGFPKDAIRSTRALSNQKS